MVLRSWRGSTRAEDADRYVEYLRQTGVREYKATPGNRGVFMLRRKKGDWIEFLLLSLWDSVESIHQFAGDDPDAAVFYPDDDAFLVQRDLHVDHYEVVEAPPALDDAGRGP